MNYVNETLSQENRIKELRSQKIKETMCIN